MPENTIADTSDRRKRQKALDHECDLTLQAWAKTLPPPKQPEPEPPVVGTIYFVGPEDGPIKIGFARRLEFRLRDLRTMSPLPLVVHARIEGAPLLERAYHKQFAAHRLHGEWFDPHPDILVEIDRLASSEGE